MRRQPPDEDPAVEALRVLVRAFQTLPSDSRLREQLLRNPAAVIVWGLASTEQHRKWEHWLQRQPARVHRLGLEKPLHGPGLVLSNPWRLQPPQHVRRRVEALDVWRSSAEGERLLTLWLDHLRARTGGTVHGIRDWLAPSVYAKMEALYPLWGGGGM